MECITIPVKLELRLDSCRKMLRWDCDAFVIVEKGAYGALDLRWVCLEGRNWKRLEGHSRGQKRETF